MSNCNSNPMPPRRPRNSLPVTSNTQAVLNFDQVAYGHDENYYDENFALSTGVGFHSQQQSRQSFTHGQSHNQNVYMAPPLQRRIENQPTASNLDSIKEQLDLLQHILKEVNRKIDVLTQKADTLEKTLDNVEKRMNSLIAKVNKFPVPDDRPSELPILICHGHNLFAGPIDPTPSHFMKYLINLLFNKEEIIEGAHEEQNERTDKIKEAIQIYFFKDDIDKFIGFWEYEGKITRGNQRRGLAFRKKLSSNVGKQLTTTTANHNSNIDNNNGSSNINNDNGNNNIYSNNNQVPVSARQNIDDHSMDL